MFGPREFPRETTVQVNPGGSDWDTHVSYNFR
jgi:hypothetical protein